MGENGVLRVLSAGQRTQLQAILEHTIVRIDEELWVEGTVADAAWLIDDALVELHEEGSAGVLLGRGALLGDIEAILRRRLSRSRALVKRGGSVFRVPAGKLTEFLDTNPGLLLALSGSQFVP
jgi:hypothetical protein